MDGLPTWVALFAAGGTLLALITFWVARGRAEALAIAKAEAAEVKASTAYARAELVAAQLSEARIEFARDYATHKDVAAAEVRFAAALDSLRVELRGMNTRLDRIIDNLAQPKE
jgi:hypothetical protein